MRRDLRLRDSRDFARLKREGRAYPGKGLVLSVMPNGLEHNRYGFVTGKTLGQAVTRNRVRRLLREAVRALHPRFKPGYDVVFIARPPLVGKPFAAVQRVMEELSFQAQILDASERR